jgi:hypothetical protein
MDVGKRKMWTDNQEKYLKAWATAGKIKRPLILETDFVNPPHSGCPLDRFMYFTAGYGQHNNQLIALMNAFVIANAINRTLVIPDFIFMHRKDGRPGTMHSSHKYTNRMYQRRYLHPSHLYNLSKYWFKYCFVYRDDFFQRNTVPQPASCYKPKKKTIRMFDAICETLVHVKRQFGHELIRPALNDTHRFIYMPEVYWYLPRNMSRDFQPLQPSAPIQKQVLQFTEKMLKTDRYTALHMRNLEGRCKQMMLSLLWAINATAQQRWAGPQQCEMNTRYISTAQETRGLGKQIVFLATDEQSPEADRRILDFGGVSFQSDIYSHHSLFFMAVDFWLMVFADIFIPNILSSVDWNVCAIRFANGRDCFNFFTDPHVTP